jgi:hypothetical protein
MGVAQVSTFPVDDHAAGEDQGAGPPCRMKCAQELGRTQIVVGDVSDHVREGFLETDDARSMADRIDAS